jgi:hypothetical protein
MGEAENTQAEADNLSGGSQADRGCAAGSVGEGETGGLKETTANRGGKDGSRQATRHLSLGFTSVQIEFTRQVLLRADWITLER